MNSTWTFAPIFVMLMAITEASAQSARKPYPREQTVRIAGIVVRWVPGDREANYRRIEVLIREAAANGAKIVCTSQRFLDGHAGTDKNLAEEIPTGTYCKRLAALAGELRIHLVAGMLEADGPARIDTAVLLGPDGKLVGKRQRSLDQNVGTGDVGQVFETPYGNVALAVGAERLRPAFARRLADRGAAALLCPSGSWGSVDDILSAQARSRENNLAIVSVHPQAFLVIGDGATRKREILGDTPTVNGKEVGGDSDQNGVCYFDLPIRPRGVETLIDKAVFEPMVGQALFHRSGIYGDLQPLAVCATDVSKKPKPLLVHLTSVAFARYAAQSCEALCKLAKSNGLDCVVLAAGGRSGGSVHQGYGEVDVYEAIAAVKKRLAIDPERISVTGSSVGGAATWYHASHYPDFWAAAAPFFGYCDHKIWERAALSAFPTRPWEEFSWVSRNAAYRPANFRHMGVRIVHGEWDRAVPGGVPVEHSRQMDRLLTKLGIEHTYIEVPKTGHSHTPELWNATIPWMLQQKRVADPDRISLVVHTLRHNRSHWVAVEQQAVAGKASTVEARRNIKDLIEVKTSNVRRLAVGPVSKEFPKLLLDNTTLARLDLTTPRSFVRAADGSWAPADGDIPAGEKRPGLSGPFGDLFVAPLIIVHGQSGSEEACDYNGVVAHSAARYFSQWNGGVHRGSIPGDNNVMLPIVSDRRLLELLAEPADGEPVELDSKLPSGDSGKVSIDRELLRRANLLLVGDARSNALLARLVPKLPITFGKNTLTLSGKTFEGEHLAFYALFPHPDGKRYVAILAGNEPEAICWGSRVGLQLLPDYLVFSRENAIDWGFWDNAWRHAGAPAASR